MSGGSVWGTAGEDLPINAEAYRDEHGLLRQAHGALRRDMPIFRIGETLRSGDVLSVCPANGLIVKHRV